MFPNGLFWKRGLMGEDLLCPLKVPGPRLPFSEMRGHSRARLLKLPDERESPGGRTRADSLGLRF